ncbi:MAG: TldD/PmbA family protein [Chlamydiae bacterium]|nr:TldD/PmbA family protein [Chlamydiota bacterium]MBI3276461.1 TldD/PmbA family protein [Chlamydiota bacterium]
MKILKEKSEQVFDTVFKTSQADETEIHFNWITHALTRFANNEIHQNMGDEDIEVSIRSSFGKKTARVTTNKTDMEYLKKMTQLSNHLASLTPEDPDLLPMPGPQTYPTVKHAYERTDHIKAETRARAVSVPIKIAQLKNLTCAGIFANDLTRHALGNSKGLRAYSEETYAVFSTTMMDNKLGSGWAKMGHPDSTQIPVETLALQASEKAILSKNPIDISAGAYTVILEPSAVLDLLEFMLLDFGGLSVLEQRSAFTEKLDKKIFGSNITFKDDIYHPLQSGAPFDGEGFPKKQIELVQNGILKNLVYSQSSALRSQKKPTGHGFPVPNAYGEAPMNFVMNGGNSSLKQMIEGTDRGLLMTRFWYIREVDPMQKILTGMTRDGTFLIENGVLKSAVKNLRFNESLFHLLNNVVELGPSVRASGEEGMDMIVPALKANDFHFTSSTKY